MATFSVRLSAKADRDVAHVLSWFHDRAAVAAGRRWFRGLLAQINALETPPERCPVAVEGDKLGVELRELHFGRRSNVYRILFVVSGRTVNVVHIQHAARDSIRPDDIT